jgi:redox-sensing transcriptional repressor
MLSFIDYCEIKNNIMITNKSCIIRLSRYKNALYRLRTLGFVKVFSDNLADAVGVLPSQVRKDFSLFGISGNKRGGYQVDILIEKLNTILGKEQTQEVIIVGLGNIGNALMKYKGFEKEGMKISACFDIDSTKYSRDSEIPILPLEEMKDFVRNKHIKIGVIAVPDVAAQSVFNMMTSCGIKGVLNFAPIRLRAASDIAVNNVNLELELENVIYFVNLQEKTKVS